MVTLENGAKRMAELGELVMKSYYFLLLTRSPPIYEHGFIRKLI